MKLYLHAKDVGGDSNHDFLFIVKHPRKNRIDLEQDYRMAMDLATTENPEEWTVQEVLNNLTNLGWSVDSLETVVVQY